MSSRGGLFSYPRTRNRVFLSGVRREEGSSGNLSPPVPSSGSHSRTPPSCHLPEGGPPVQPEQRQPVFSFSHRKLHSGMKTYGCELCGKRFLDSLRLRMHLLAHSGRHGGLACPSPHRQPPPALFPPLREWTSPPPAGPGSTVSCGCSLQVHGAESPS